MAEASKLNKPNVDMTAGSPLQWFTDWLHTQAQQANAGSAGSGKSSPAMQQAPMPGAPPQPAMQNMQVPAAVIPFLLQNIVPGMGPQAGQQQPVQNPDAQQQQPGQQGGSPGSSASSGGGGGEKGGGKSGAPPMQTLMDIFSVVAGMM